MIIRCQVPILFGLLSISTSPNMTTYAYDHRVHKRIDFFSLTMNPMLCMIHNQSVFFESMDHDDHLRNSMCNNVCRPRSACREEPLMFKVWLVGLSRLHGLSPSTKHRHVLSYFLLVDSWFIYEAS